MNWKCFILGHKKVLQTGGDPNGSKPECLHRCERCGEILIS